MKSTGNPPSRRKPSAKCVHPPGPADRGSYKAAKDFISRLGDNPEMLTILGDGQQAKSYLLSEECVAAMLFAVDFLGRIPR